MNYLFCLNGLNDHEKANINITYILANEIGNNSKSFVIGFDNAVQTVIEEKKGNFVLIKCPSNKKKEAIKEEKYYISRFQYIIKHPLKQLEYLFLKTKDEIIYLKEIKKIVRVYKAKVILPTFPFYSAYLVSKYLRNYIVFQMDPWGLHETINKDNRMKLIKQEQKLFNKAAHIFTTPVLYNTYVKNKHYKKYINKLAHIEFPLLKEYKEKIYRFDDNYINIVYTGTLGKGLRDPKYIINFLNQIINDNKIKIRLFIYGFVNEECLQELEKYDYIQIKNIVSKEEINKIINSNVVLLNINNTVKNQMPSKLIDYISTGNRIINVVKNNDDISLVFLEKYKNYFNIYEYENNDKEKFISFLINDKQIPYNEIETLYKECKPSYVAKQIMTIINDKNYN